MPTARIIEKLAELQPAAWDALHNGANPFVSHAFLSGLEQFGCLRADWGWTPQHLTLWDGDALMAAAPGYLKSNSHGEFVFDHAWAHAYARYGQDYFPKYLCAAPYSPVTGPRLLARDAASRRLLVEAMAETTRASGLSSAHVNFHEEADDAAFPDAWLRRIDVQYHWRNPSGWATFEDFLGAMDHKHRKNIRQERAKVAAAGIAFRTLHGDEASDEDLATIYGYYLRTFAEYGNSPALTLDFVRHLARAMPRSLVIFLAERDGAPVAAALCLRGGDTLYGRYWGAHDAPDRARVSGLHFETCYYQGIEYCLHEGLRVFEPGAQGEHKLKRGFLPAFVRSRHFIADPAFSEALGLWCAEEARSVHSYAAALSAHSPFRDAAAAPL